MDRMNGLYLIALIALITGFLLNVWAIVQFENITAEKNKIVLACNEHYQGVITQNYIPKAGYWGVKLTGWQPNLTQ